MMVGVLGVLTE